MAYTTLPTRGPTDLQAAITDTRAPAANELSADSIEAIKDRLIEIGTAVGIDAGTGTGALRRGYLPTLLQLPGAIFPAQITADQNNYAPSGIADASTLFLESDAADRKITGIAGGAAGRVLILSNIGSFDIDLSRESGASAGANQISGPGSAATRIVAGGGACVLVYVGAAAKWIPIASVHRPAKVTAATVPAVTDDRSLGYQAGSLWVDAASGFYICGDATEGAAVWRQLVQSIRTISAGTGLTGGGDLSSNRTLSVDFGEAGDIVAVGTANAAGASGEVADAAHVHAHGAQTDTTLHGLATSVSGAHGFMSADDKDLLFDSKRVTEEHEDFFGNAGVLQTHWGSSLTGAGSSAAGVSGYAAGHPGICNLNTGTTATGRSAIYRNATLPLRFKDGAYAVEVIARVPTLADGTDDFAVNFGLGDSVFLLEPNNGIFFAYQRGVSANWLGCASAGGVFTRTSTGVAVTAGAWVRCGIRINAAGTSIDFQINGSTVATVTTNIPGATALYGPSVVLLKSLGTNGRTLDIDYIAQRIEITGGR